MAETLLSPRALPLAPTLAAIEAMPRPGLERLRTWSMRWVQLSATQPGTRPADLDRSARRGLLATLRRMELEPAGIDLWMAAGELSAAATADRAAALVLETIRLAGDLGRVPVSLALWLGDEAEADGADHEAIIDAIAGEAERWGVALADHALPPRARGAIGVGIDPAAILAGGGDPAAAVMDAGSSLVSARLVDLLRDGTRGPIGEENGRLDVTAYRVALSVSGFARPVVLDARRWPDPASGIQRCLELWSA